MRVLLRMYIDTFGFIYKNIYDPSLSRPVLSTQNHDSLSPSFSPLDQHCGAKLQFSVHALYTGAPYFIRKKQERDKKENVGENRNDPRKINPDPQVSFYLLLEDGSATRF